MYEYVLFFGLETSQESFMQQVTHYMIYFMNANNSNESDTRDLVSDVVSTQGVSVGKSAVERIHECSCAKNAGGVTQNCHLKSMGP